LKRGATNLLKRTPDIASSIVSKFLREKTGEITKEVVESLKHLTIIVLTGRSDLD
jgi:hypothetical protein